MPALEAFHTLGKVHWQTSYALSSIQSCETVILLLKAGGTLAITPGGKKNKCENVEVSHPVHRDTGR